jgi:uncharacterized protein YjbJ (UPF0337 family)
VEGAVRPAAATRPGRCRQRGAKLSYAAWQRVPTPFAGPLGDSAATGRRRRSAASPESTEAKGAGMNKDQVKGRMEEAKGKIEESTGKAIGNPNMRDKGAADKTAGKAQKNLGDAKEKVKDAVDKI